MPCHLLSMIILRDVMSLIHPVLLPSLGMTCSACTGTIESALQSTKGILSARVSLLTEQAEIVYDRTIIQPQQIVDEIEAVGFDAK